MVGIRLTQFVDSVGPSRPLRPHATLAARNRRGPLASEEALNAKFKVLITSGYMEVDSSFPAIREKGYQFLQKPYEIPDLLRSVRHALGMKL